MILRQQQKIGELVYRAEETARNLSKLGSRERRSVDLRPSELKSPNFKNPKLGSSTVSHKY